MSFQSFLDKLDKQNRLMKIKKPVSPRLEASGLLKVLDGKPVFFEKIEGSDFPVAGNVFSSRELVADYFGIPASEIVKKMLYALEHPSKPKTTTKAPCQEVGEDAVDLSRLPILFHCEKDGGPYVSSGIVFARDKTLGQNASFHRGMVIGKNKLALRILERHLRAFIDKNGGEIDAAMCVGNAANVGLAAATSVGLGTDEMTFANALEPLEMVKCKTIDVTVPAESEFVFEGRITKETHSEGPFVDLTETYDLKREQQVFEIKKITHRKNAVWQALLPGALEHKLLMGMPREPTIFREVSKEVACKNVFLTPGGCSWLHGVVQIKKKSEADGKKAIEAAFRRHSSLKHVVVVDEDINIFEPSEVEWAFATRFQASRGLVVKEKQKGSSLDPSADPQTRETAKAGFDATKPLVVKGKHFEKAVFPHANVEEFKPCD